MSTNTSPAPGSGTPGGELQQISPGALPTADGAQTENTVPEVALEPPALCTHTCGNEQLRKNWDRVETILRQRYPELTDNDLLYVRGQEAAFFQHIQEKTGHTRLEIEEVLDFHN